MLTALALLLLGATVDVTVAPDQPIPHVYMDDPVILELRSAENTQATVTLEVQPENGGTPAKIALEPVFLRARSAYWSPLEGIPALRGLYRMKASIDAGGAASEGTYSFCRIDRPAPGTQAPVCAVASEMDEKALLAARDIGVRRVVFPSDLPDVPRAIEVAKRLGLEVEFAFLGKQLEQSEALLKQIAPDVKGWRLDGQERVETLTALVKAIRQTASKAPVTVSVKDIATFTALVAAGFGPSMERVVVKDAELEPFVAGIQPLGYERLNTISLCGKEDAKTPSSLIRRLVRGQALGALYSDIALSDIYTGDAFGTDYAALGALGQRLSGAFYVGDFPAAEGVESHVFRQGAHWMIAFWAKQTPGDVIFKVGDAAELALWDARGNSAKKPELADGGVTVAAAQEPRFLVGQAGSVILETARNELQAGVQHFLGTEEFKNGFPNEVFEQVRKLASAGGKDEPRLDFLNLLRIFPVAERMWHAGEIPRSVAVPALSCLNQVARALCTIEQERGEPFVEPLSKTLADCGRLQSVYLTGAASNAATDVKERPDWLYAEVGRLVQEAERLSEDQRLIEACAVATLANWRAQALEFAAKAKPLNVAEVAPPPPPEPKKEEPKKDAKDAKKDSKDPKSKPNDKNRNDDPKKPQPAPKKKK